MEPSTNSYSANPAEQVSPQSVATDPHKAFTIYLQSYLTRQGLDETFVADNIDAEVVLASFRDLQANDIPAPAQRYRSPDQRRSDHVCTGHLQRFLITNGFDPAVAKQITGVHIYDSVIDVMPPELLPKSPTAQANQTPNTPESLEKAPRKDSLMGSKAAAEDDDDEDDMPVKHRRTPHRSRYVEQVRSGRIKKHVKKQVLDFSKKHHKIQTACLSDINVSKKGIYNLHISSQKYDKFLCGSAAFLATRFAAVSLTLARAGEIQSARVFGQYGIDLVGPALFNAYLADHEMSEDWDEENSMLFAKMMLTDCVVEVTENWYEKAAVELREMVIDHGLWWAKALAQVKEST